MSMKQKTFSDVKQFVELVANKQAWKLNPDQDLLDMLIEGLTINFNRYGYFSCPCRDADGERSLDKDIICPCDYCIPDQLDFGHCYCGLFLTNFFSDSGIAPVSIPERRNK